MQEITKEPNMQKTILIKNIEKAPRIVEAAPIKGNKNKGSKESSEHQ